MAILAGLVLVFLAGLAGVAVLLARTFLDLDATRRSAISMPFGS